MGEFTASGVILDTPSEIGWFHFMLGRGGDGVLSSVVGPLPFGAGLSNHHCCAHGRNRLPMGCAQ